MIEYYLFMHKGGQPQYQDGVVPIANPELSIGIIASSKLGDQAKAASKMFKDTLGSELNKGSIMDLAKEIDLRIPDNAEYIIFSAEHRLSSCFTSVMIPILTSWSALMLTVMN